MSLLAQQRNKLMHDSLTGSKRRSVIGKASPTQTITSRFVKNIYQLLKHKSKLAANQRFARTITLFPNECAADQVVANRQRRV